MDGSIDMSESTTLKLPKVTTTDTMTTTTTVAVAMTVPSTKATSTNRARRHNEPALSSELLSTLAKQLEYYFSDVNLRRDTYLTTLRDLNEGYVPATILSQFLKVQALVGAANAYNAVITAARDYSQDLIVVFVHKERNTRCDQETEETITCIGTTNQLPLPTIVEPVPHRPTMLVPTTIIIRDVPLGTTEQNIRQCFEATTTIQSIHQDVAQCWFVTMNASTTRDDMIRIMSELRSKTIQGETVKARLKTVNSVAVYAGDRNVPYIEPPATTKKEKKARRAPPIIPLSQFPSLKTDRPTTPAPVLTTNVGYAAALLKPKPPTPPPQPPKQQEQHKRQQATTFAVANSTGTKRINGKTMEPNKESRKHMMRKQEITPDEPPEKESQQVPAVVKMPWGGGKSFADVLKQETGERI